MTLLKGTNSTLDGFTTTTFDKDKALSTLHSLQAQGYRYGLGCKPVDYIASPPVCKDYLGRYGGADVNRIDCSGFHKYILWHAAQLEVPDGSINQNDFYASQGFKHDRTSGPYDPLYISGMNPAYIYACFCRTGTRGETIGHVWLCIFLNGKWWTIESCGAGGPVSRPYDTPILAHIVTDLYPIAKVG